MSAMHEGELRTAVRFECWSCEATWFVPIDQRSDIEQCPVCQADEGLGVQGRRFEVTTK